MQQYIARPDLLAAIVSGLSQVPVVALLGARQVGKTTLAQQAASEWSGPSTVLDLEVATVREALSATPERLLRQSEGLVVLDEVQRMPGLFEILRPICDDRNRKAVFLLLGSASWDLIQGDLGDSGGKDSLRGRGRLLACRGGAAEPGSPLDARRLSAGLAGALGGGMDPLDAVLYAHLSGEGHSGTGLKNISRSLGPLLEDAGPFSRPSLERNRTGAVDGRERYGGEPLPGTLLAGTFMIRVLPPWSESLGKRIVKSPKVYLRDSGILHYLLGLEEMQELPMHPRYGASWEGFALEQTLLAHGDREACFYGTQRGAELDLMLLRRGRRWGFEFKCTDAPRTTKSMHIVIEDLGVEHLWVVYPGDREYPLTDTITALPLKKSRPRTAPDAMTGEETPEL